MGSFKKVFQQLNKNRTMRYGAWSLAALSAVVLVSNLTIFVKGSGQSVSSIEGVERTQVAIVPGARVWPDGTPSWVLQQRLDGAYELYKADKVEHILVSGDNRESHYDESSAMQSYLINRGVPLTDVTADYAGFDTWDTCLRAKEQFGVSEAVVVTQKRYVSRSASLCESAGIDTQILALQNPPYSTTKKLQAMARERLASVKAFGDVLRKPDAHHGGEFIGLIGSEEK